MREDIFYSILAVVGVISYVWLFVKYGDNTRIDDSSSNQDLAKLRQIEEYNRIEKLTREISNDK